MGDMGLLKTGKGPAREQLLELAAHQARVQGKSLAQYLRELQAQIERKGEGGTAPRPVPARVPREQYVYLTRREVELFFDQITALRVRRLPQASPAVVRTQWGANRATVPGVIVRSSVW